MVWKIQMGISKKRTDSEFFSNITNDQAAQARRLLIRLAEILVNALLARLQKRDERLEKTSIEICLLCLTAIEAPRNPSQSTH